MLKCSQKEVNTQSKVLYLANRYTFQILLFTINRLLVKWIKRYLLSLFIGQNNGLLSWILCKFLIHFCLNHIIYGPLKCLNTRPVIPLNIRRLYQTGLLGYKSFRFLNGQRRHLPNRASDFVTQSPVRKAIFI